MISEDEEIDDIEIHQTKVLDSKQYPKIWKPSEGVVDLQMSHQ